MKGCLLLLLLLLGTVSALYLEKDVPHLGDLETQADLSQDSEGSGGQEGELALSGEVLESGREEAEDTHDDEGASDPDDLDEDVQCPKEEETVQLLGSPECKSCRYRLVGTPRRFKKAQRVCRKCYRGNLASIHNFNVNLIIHRLSTTTNYGQVWIGGFIRGRRTNTAVTPGLAQPPESWVHRERGSPDAASSSGWYLGKCHPSILRTGAGLRQSRRRGDGPPAGKSHPFSPCDLFSGTSPFPCLML
ncbi:PREDICTED: proteoglycan 3-like [Bison bison bison]|uniref:Proteoglycan 3-like n=1 Tax=Bison bison bison TaxID=43346 RepID=A0A6P3HMX4_BISBB|nr:PREDICTED: proteoglycan 3-like [Bison bison bison]